MNKKYLGLIVLIMLSFSSCNDDFLNISPRDFITDDAVWSSGTATKMFINDIYNSSLAGPLYSFASINNQQFDNLFTDDAGWNFKDSWTTFNFTASNAPFNRWDDCYTNIRKTNIGIEKLAESDVMSVSEKKRYLGDLHFLRGLLYFELFRFYGGVPIITKPLDRMEDDIYYARNTLEETFKFVIDEFQTASDLLYVSVDDSEYGRATKGAALGMLAEAYLHGAGVVDSRYFADAATTANIFISGELNGRYRLFGENETDPVKKLEAYQNLFLEPYEGNEEVIFDVQYADNKLRSHNGYQTVAAPGVPGVNQGFGWGNSVPSQNLVDQYEMTDGSAFDWNNPEQASDPYANRDLRFYADILYHGIMWKGAELSLSSNRFDNNGKEITNNTPNGLKSTKKESTKSGYYLRKHQWEAVVCGSQNKSQGIDDGGNLIVLRYAEILLIYAEAKNEVSGPDASVYAAVNQVRSRAGQPNLPTGLSKAEMREKIRHERRVELCFENKRFFDIVRWNIGDDVLNQPLMGINPRYVKVGSEIKITYTKWKIVNKVFSGPKNNLLPIPQSAIDQNPKLEQNPGW